MKILGEKSATFSDKVVKFLYIHSFDRNTIRETTDAKCLVYHINCTVDNGNFVICDGMWNSSKRVVDALSQINQHNTVVPYVQIMCDSDNASIIAQFMTQKAKWSKSFKKLVIV